MWSLPDINSLNLNAKSCATAYDRQTKLKRSVKYPCETCGKPSTSHVKYFDIFSEDAKGVLHSCYDHADNTEGFFTCDCCGRLVVENYTWEYYRVHKGGLTICLTCAAENHFADDANLIDPAEVKSVVLDPQSASKLLFKDWVLNLAKAEHVLGVKQPFPEGIEYVDNIEFDSHSGRQISGGDALKLIQSLDHKFFLVLDGAYQFAASIGIYKHTTK